MYQQMFVKFSNNKSHKNQYIGTRTVPRRPTDGTERHDGAISDYFQLECAYSCMEKSNEIPI